MRSRMDLTHRTNRRRLILDAVSVGDDTILAVARRTGMTERVVRREAKKLAAEGLLVMEKRRRFDPQRHRDGWGYSLFGGAGSCIRRYFKLSLPDQREEA